MKPDDLNDWRTARNYRWTRPDGSLDVLAMCRHMDDQYAAMFQPGPMRSLDAAGYPQVGVPTVEMEGPGAAGTAPGVDETVKESRHA